MHAAKVFVSSNVHHCDSSVSTVTDTVLPFNFILQVCISLGL